MQFQAQQQLGEVNYFIPHSKHTSREGDLGIQSQQPLSAADGLSGEEGNAVRKNFDPTRILSPCL